MKTFSFTATATDSFKGVPFIKILRGMCGHGLSEAKGYLDMIRNSGGSSIRLEVPVYGGSLGYTNSGFETMCMCEAGLIVVCDGARVAASELINTFLHLRKYELAIDAIKLLEKMDNQL